MPTIPIVLRFKPSTSSAKGIAQSSSFSIASLSSGMAKLISFSSFSGEVSDKSRVELSSSDFELDVSSSFPVSQRSSSDFTKLRHRYSILD